MDLATTVARFALSPAYEPHSNGCLADYPTPAEEVRDEELLRCDAIVMNLKPKGEVTDGYFKAGPDLLPLATNGNAGSARGARLHGAPQPRRQRTSRHARGDGREP